MRRSKSYNSLIRLLRENLIHLIIALAFLFFVTAIISYQKTEKEPHGDNVINSYFTSHARNDSIRNKAGRKIEKYHPLLSSILFNNSLVNESGDYGLPGYLKTVSEAFETGKKLWHELNETSNPVAFGSLNQSTCPKSVSLIGPNEAQSGHLVELPCGLEMGSQVTFFGTPRKAWPKLEKGLYTMVSQFSVELRALKAVDGEEPPRIFHFNPRVKGDQSNEPVIGMNTRFRMKWGKGIRCDGDRSNDKYGTVDGLPKCERWLSEEPKVVRWLKKVIGLTEADWTFPLREGKSFVLAIRAGLEGYHVSIDGKHITSFPYHKGFTLEDATGLSIDGDVDVHSIYVAPLPTSHPNNDPEKLLQMSCNMTAQPLQDGSGEMFVGVISVGNHYAERMAIRKSWMQHPLIKSSEVIVRFFVAMHATKGVNAMVKKEAEFYKDIVIVPYLDQYNLVVLKTIAIADYGLNVVNAKYIMKCDDDTFVKIDAIVDKIKKVPEDQSLYMGRINRDDKVWRTGKWAVTYEEWAGAKYPNYADGSGYIMTSDIAEFIVSRYKKHKLKLFRMEDVCMGMWVEQYQSSKAVSVKYIHSANFLQNGCVENYITAHYQSPKQMICLWNKLQKHERPQCCDS